MYEKNIQWRECDNASGRHCVRYASGLSCYEETLYDGRWITSGASVKGMADEDPILFGSLENNSAFDLEIDGQSLHRGWEFARATQETHEAGTDVIVVLENSIRPVRLTVHTLLTGTAIFSRWLEIENTGDRPAALGKLAVWSGRVFPTQSADREFREDMTETFTVPHSPFEMGYIAQNDAFREGNFQWRPIDTREIRFGSERGRSGWGHPIVYLRDRGCGELFLLQLGWSGNWEIKIRPENYFNDNITHLRRSEILFAGAYVTCKGPQRIIEPGETITTPEVYFGRTSNDINALAQQMHEHHRLCVIPPQPEGRENLISYNHAGYDIIANTSNEKLRREIEIAAELGADVFMIDAGWYGNNDEHWSKNLGDWQVGNRLPQGLEPIFDYARSKGLKCGLWAWIEAASKTSDLIKEHPDWLLELDGNYLDSLLDLSKPEVAAWVESQIVRLIETYDLDVFRLDYNVSPAEGGYNRKHGYDENTLWRHYEALYAIFDRVRRKFPHVLLENCAGGGGRTDMGMLHHLHYTWLSDSQTQPNVVRLLNTALLTMPPEATAGFFGACMNAHFAGTLQTQLRTTFLMGNPAIIGVWPEHEDKNPILRDEIRRYIKIFREHVRPILRDCLVYHHATSLPGIFATGWCCLEYARPDRTKSVIGVFRLGPDDEPTYTVKPQGLSPAGTYKVYCDNRQVQFECSGLELMNTGLNITLESAISSELLIIEIQE